MWAGARSRCHHTFAECPSGRGPASRRYAGRAGHACFRVRAPGARFVRPHVCRPNRKRCARDHGNRRRTLLRVLLHLRLTMPSDLTGEVRALIEGNDCTTNIVVQPGVSVVPDGDLIECDVAREAGNELLENLAGLGLGERGGIIVTTPTGTPFDEARRLEELAPGDPDDVVIWASVQSEAEADEPAHRLLPRLPGARGHPRRHRGHHRLLDPGRRRHGRGAGVRGDRGGMRGSGLRPARPRRGGGPAGGLRVRLRHRGGHRARRPRARGRADHQRDGHPAAPPDRIHLASRTLVVRGRRWWPEWPGCSPCPRRRRRPWSAS